MSRYVVGIGLGTTNSAVAYVDTQAQLPAVENFSIVQAVQPGQFAARPTQPSFLYLSAPTEFAPDAFRFTPPAGADVIEQ